jgi:hypothetical protein
MTPELTGFAHRQNTDATYDVICLKCFLAVGRSPSLDGLSEIQATHLCTGFAGERVYISRIKELENECEQLRDTITNTNKMLSDLLSDLRRAVSMLEGVCAYRNRHNESNPDRAIPKIP